MIIIDFLWEISRMWNFPRRSHWLHLLIRLLSMIWLFIGTRIQNVWNVVLIIDARVIVCLGRENRVHLYIFVRIRRNVGRLHDHTVWQFRHLYHFVLWIPRLLVPANNESDHDACDDHKENGSDDSTNNCSNWNLAITRTAIFHNI